MRNFAPTIYRQRLVIEGVPKNEIISDDIKTFLLRLSTALKMKTLLAPVTHKSDKYGWAAWIHWESSGCHVYAWDAPLFFSVDIYTCKKFSVKTAVAFTKSFFNCEKISYKSF